jgi:hypothetical protein
MVDFQFVALMTIVAFASGAFGTMIGSLHTFSFAAILIIAGEAANLAGRGAILTVDGVDPAAYGAVGITANIGLGAMMGPQIAFAGALAAIAYAAKKGYMESNWGYHHAKNIFQPFSPDQLDVVVVGGLFGALGYLVTFGLATVSAPLDPVAGSIVITAIVHRVVLGYDVLGKPAGDGYFDLSPFEREDIVEGDTESGEPADRLAVEVWLPWMYQWRGLVFLGIVAGILGAFTFYVTGSPLLVFGISGLAFLILNDGMEDNFGELRFPIAVQHHMTVPASLAAFAYSGVPLSEVTAQTVAAAVPMWQVLIIGALFGLLGSLLGEVAERIVYAHGDTHFDPPATSIALTTLLIGILAIVGVFPSGGLVPVP